MNLKDTLRENALQKGFVEICCEYKHHTPGAVLINDGDRDIWVPRSLTAGLDTSVEKGEHIELIVKQWFAEKEGLV